MSSDGYEARLSGYQDQLNDSLSQIKLIKQSKEFDLFKFGAIAFVCGFFAFVLINNTLKTLHVYSRATSSEKFEKPKVTDDNKFYNFENDINYKEVLTKSINKSRIDQNKKLMGAKVELIASDENNRNMKPEDYRLEADIDMNSIDRVQDDYNYEKNNKETSFWRLMFVKKNYSNI
jgi:hypothetical protein